MSSTDPSSVLRERNKELLRQLRKQGERLQQFTRIQGLADSLDEAKENSTHDVTEMITLIDGNRGPARAALTKPTVSFKDDRSSVIETEGLSRAAELSKEGNRRPAIHYRPQEKRKPITSSILLDQDRERREVGSRVTFRSPEWEQISASESERRRVQPLLGYDWIAGVLDVESSLTERSEEFFNDLRTFRAVNRDECVHSQQEGFSEEGHSVLALLTDEEAQQPNVDTHRCTFCYRINSRLFATPLDPQECCPVCKKPKSIHPHTTAEPAFIRVSIPRSTLLPSYRYKAHRRSSFDPSDSLGLPSHCLSGWSNTGQSTVAQPSSLDLRSCLNVETPTSLPLAQSQIKEHSDLSVSRVSGSQRSDQILDMSRLARYRFQHLSPKSKLYSTSYPVY